VAGLTNNDGGLKVLKRNEIDFAWFGAPRITFEFEEES